MARSTEGGITSDKCGIIVDRGGVTVSVTGQIIFVRGSNTQMKMNGAIAGDSETRQNKCTSRQWGVTAYTVHWEFMCMAVWTPYRTICAHSLVSIQLRVNQNQVPIPLTIPVSIYLK